MGTVTTAYPSSYLEKHEVYEDQVKDRSQARRIAKELRQKGFTVKVTRICPFGEYIWVLDGERVKNNERR